MSVKVQAEIWKHSKHKGGPLLLMLAIGDFADDEGVAFPSIQTLAQKTRMSERAVHYMIAALVESGELSIERGAGPKGCNLFSVGANIAGANIAGGAKKAQKALKRGATAIAPKPSEENHHKKGKGNNAPEDPRRAPFIAHVFETRPDLVTDASDFQALKRLLTTTRDKPQFALEKLLDYWARFLNSPDKFHRNQGKPLRFFCTNVNTFVTMNGNYSEAEVEAANKRHEELYKGKLR